MFKRIGKVCKKVMDKGKEICSSLITEVKTLNGDDKISIGISVIGVGISIGLGLITSGILQNRRGDQNV